MENQKIRRSLDKDKKKKDKQDIDEDLYERRKKGNKKQSLKVDEYAVPCSVVIVL